MKKKTLTQRFPWLLPLRRFQRKLCFYRAMARDGAQYSKKQQGDSLPIELFYTSCPMINYNTGFDLKYQENKVFNLKLAAKKLDGLLIAPGETFSFWQSVRHADRETPYKSGLAEINGKLTTQYGGGLCMLSNLLFWTMLHSPLSITERHGHQKKDFPEPPSDALYGVDATVAEGWLDLKMKNDTSRTFQLRIGFEDDKIFARLLTDLDEGQRYQILNGPVSYRQKPDGIFESAPVIQRRYDLSGRLLEEKQLYCNQCLIGYELPKDLVIERECG